MCAPALLAGLAISTGPLLLNELIKKKDETTTTPVAPVAPTTPTTEERAKVTTDVVKEAKLKRRVRTGLESTILTSPLGLEGTGNTMQKTLLGE